jgi:hypothetical protein
LGDEVLKVYDIVLVIEYRPYKAWGHESR